MMVSIFPKYQDFTGAEDTAVVLEAKPVAWAAFEDLPTSYPPVPVGVTPSTVTFGAISLVASSTLTAIAVALY